MSHSPLLAFLTAVPDIPASLARRQPMQRLLLIAHASRPRTALSFIEAVRHLRFSLALLDEPATFLRLVETMVVADPHP